MNARPPCLPTYGELIPWFASVNAGVLEAVTARELSQPFRVDWFVAVQTVTMAVTVRLQPGIFRGPTLPSAITDNFTPLVVSAANDQSIEGRLIVGTTPQVISLGIAIYDVPCRLGVLIDNGSGGVVAFGGTFSITHLADPYRRGTPPSENGSAAL